MNIKSGDIVRFPLFVSLDDKPVAQLNGFGQVLEIEGDRALIQAIDKTTWENMNDLFVISTEEEFYQKRNEWLKERNSELT